ncbi:MAG: hypothetical protein CVV44_10405 [Spirochaetae bacterium HGW-Spirochaetae-1]|jgi:AcrR family transcriptional regulator|nr:MAG: hypothetical protein CVV44_10405 [Spirochaetae bacterium HGW-Spirochaetae-1]
MKNIKEKKRIPSAERKEQIIAGAMSLIFEKGISGMTMGGIAQKVGISEPALYRHFDNRREILLATLDHVSRLLIGSYVVKDGDVLQSIRLTSETLYQSLMNHPEAGKVLFEFICSSPAEDLRGNLKDLILNIINLAQALLGEGARQGVLKNDMDVSLKAWEMFSLAFTLSFASLLGLENVLTRDKAMAAIENFIGSIEAS